MLCLQNKCTTFLNIQHNICFCFYVETWHVEVGRKSRFIGTASLQLQQTQKILLNITNSHHKNIFLY